MSTSDVEAPTPAPTMSSEEAVEYRTHLRNELADLEFAQEMVWSQYKQDRIVRLKGRLGIPLD